MRDFSCIGFALDRRRKQLEKVSETDEIDGGQARPERVFQSLVRVWVGDVASFDVLVSFFAAQAVDSTQNFN